MLTLRTISGKFKICRFSAETPLPAALFTLPLYSVTRIGDELSVLVPETVQLNADTVEDGWGMLGVAGPLDFALTGILARIAEVLAAADISIFALSTYDTDYILVKHDKLQAAITALKAAGYQHAP